MKSRLALTSLSGPGILQGLDLATDSPDACDMTVLQASKFKSFHSPHVVRYATIASDHQAFMCYNPLALHCPPLLLLQSSQDFSLSL